MFPFCIRFWFLSLIHFQLLQVLGLEKQANLCSNNWQDLEEMQQDTITTC